MENNNSAPQGMDLFTMQSMSKGAGGGAEQSGGALGSLLSRLTGINLTNIGSIGLFSNLNFSAAGLKADSSIVRGEGFSPRGGVLARELGVVASKENLFAGVTQNPVESLPVEAMAQVNDIRSMMGEGMPVSAMSYGDLGNLTPSAGGGMSRGQDMGMMA
jgi:hypothetical protein